MLILGLIGLRSGATILYRMTFDHTGAAGGEANAIYTAGPGDLLDPHQSVIRYGTNPVPQIVASDGPQAVARWSRPRSFREADKGRDTPQPQPTASFTLFMGATTAG